jgi:WD40 repeat protein
LRAEEKSSNLKNVVEESAAEDDLNFGFEIDRTGQGSGGEEEQEEREEEDVMVESATMEQKEKHYSSSDDDDDKDGEEEEDAPAWEDPDDATTKLVDASSRLKKLRTTRQEATALSSQELEERLRKRYEESTQATARTDWATTITTKSKHTRLADSDEEEEDGVVDLFSMSTELLSTSRNRLPPNRLDIIRCPDANLVDPNKAVVRAVSFHPGSDPDRPLLLTAGLDKTLRFFQVGEEKSEKIHGIHCKYGNQM